MCSSCQTSSYGAYVLRCQLWGAAFQGVSRIRTKSIRNRLLAKTWTEHKAKENSGGATALWGAARGTDVQRPSDISIRCLPIWVPPVGGCAYILACCSSCTQRTRHHKNQGRPPQLPLTELLGLREVRQLRDFLTRGFHA